MATIEAYHHPASAEIATGSDGVTILAEGMALAERTLADERRQVVAFRSPGDMLCLDRGVVTTSRLRLVAVTPVTVCRVAADVVRDFGRRYASFHESLMGAACREISWLGERLLVLGRMSAQERIAIFLLEMLARTDHNGATDGGASVRLPMNREDIADYLGLNVETVSRTLSRFKRQGLIQLPKPGRAVIGDIAPLKALAPIRIEGLEGLG